MITKFATYWWQLVVTSSKWGKFLLWRYIWPWRSRSITRQNNRDLNRDLLHLWSKFGDPSLKPWWAIARTNFVMDGWTEGRTDAGNDNTRRPILASGKKGLILLKIGVTNRNIANMSRQTPILRHLVSICEMSLMWERTSSFEPGPISKGSDLCWWGMLYHQISFRN